MLQLEEETEGQVEALLEQMGAVWEELQAVRRGRDALREANRTPAAAATSPAAQAGEAQARRIAVEGLTLMAASKKGLVVEGDTEEEEDVLRLLDDAAARVDELTRALQAAAVREAALQAQNQAMAAQNQAITARVAEFQKAFALAGGRGR